MRAMTNQFNDNLSCNTEPEYDQLVVKYTSFTIKMTVTLDRVPLIERKKNWRK